MEHGDHVCWLTEEFFFHGFGTFVEHLDGGRVKVAHLDGHVRELPLSHVALGWETETLKQLEKEVCGGWLSV